MLKTRSGEVEERLIHVWDINIQEFVAKLRDQAGDLRFLHSSTNPPPGAGPTVCHPVFPIFSAFVDENGVNKLASRFDRGTKPRTEEQGNALSGKRMAKEPAAQPARPRSGRRRKGSA